MLLAGVFLAALFWYVTSSVSAGISCGAYNYGPETSAEKAFCGEPGSNYTLQFHLVQVIPALAVLVGAAWAALERHGRYLGEGSARRSRPRGHHLGARAVGEMHSWPLRRRLAVALEELVRVEVDELGAGQEGDQAAQC